MIANDRITSRNHQLTIIIFSMLFTGIILCFDCCRAKKKVKSLVSPIQWIGLRETLQESPIFHGKITENRWFPVKIFLSTNPLTLFFDEQIHPQRLSRALPARGWPSIPPSGRRPAPSALAHLGFLTDTGYL